MSSYNYLLTTPDPELPGQSFTCVSFLEPKDGDLVEMKQKFYSMEFSKYLTTEAKKVYQFVAENPDTPLSIHMKVVMEPSDTDFEEMYEGFLNQNKQTLDALFVKKYNPKGVNTERGLKIRGVFATVEQASAHAKMLSDMEGNVFNIFVASVGHWMPFAPKQQVETTYYDDKLNDLINHKQDERAKNELKYHHRKMDMMAAQEEEQKRLSTVQEDDESEEKKEE